MLILAAASKTDLRTILLLAAKSTLPFLMEVSILPPFGSPTFDF